MKKVWQTASKIPNSFFEKFSKYDEVILQLLYNRGLREKEEIDLFLKGEIADILDPFLFVEMEEATELVIGHIKKRNKICIYGDYDADGLTSSAILFELLSVFKAEVFVYIPDRISEGYGVNKKAIDKIKKDGAKLIITVDSGIRNREEIQYAKDSGLEFVLTDHHPGPEGKDELPDCVIIDSALKKEAYPFKSLAGVGVAFKLASALIKKSTLKDEEKIKLTERFLDLVAIGSIADMVPLVNENRILTKEGLKVLNKTSRIGLKEIIKISALEGKELNERSVGFHIAPRLNASGRIGEIFKSGLGQSPASMRILVEKDREKAVLLAEKLSGKNQARQELTGEMTAEMEKQAEKQKKEKIIIGICPEDKCWSEGIVGLVAGKITEKYYRPSIVITKKENDFKGSGRSVPELDLASVIDEVAELLGNHGGHPMACAFNLPAKNFDEFISRVRKIVSKRLAGIELVPRLEIDCELDLKKINIGLAEKIMGLSPFGKGNPEPVFLSAGLLIKDVFKMGREGEHIKLKLGSTEYPAIDFCGIAFGRSEEWKDFKIGDEVDAVYNLDINKFNGREEAQLKLIDLKKK